MENKQFKNELRIKYLNLLAQNNEINAFIEYFNESEQYINDIINNKTSASPTILKEIIAAIKYRKSVTLKQKI